MTGSELTLRNPGEASRDWIWNSLELRLRRSKGVELQKFLATVMKRAHGDKFLAVGTDHAWGDLKCDGLLTEPLTVFACYGAVDSGERTTRSTIRRVAAKIEDDFAGASGHWKELKRWAFVTNYLELPALVAKSILSLKEKNPGVSIDVWDLDRFYDALGALPLPEVQRILCRDLASPTMDTTPRHATASRPVGRFFGREDELDLHAPRIAAGPDPGAFLVLGAPGIGKTALTHRLANRPEVVRRFGERRMFVSLEGALTKAAVELAVATSLGSHSFRDAVGLFSGEAALFVLDNLETPWETSPRGVEEVVSELIEAGFTVLASMRGFDLPRGLAWDAIRLKPLKTDPSRELFLAVADRIPAHDPHLAVLLNELGGVPLAIELVAHQAAAFAHAEPMLREWERIGTALASDAVVARGRLSSLDVSIELSISSPRLTDAGRRLLRTLSALPAGSAVGHVPHLIGDEAYAAMRSCLATGLAFEREGRLNLLPPIRRYVARRWGGEDCPTAWVSFYAGFVARTLDNGVTARDRRSAVAEVSNVVRAVETALTDGTEVLAGVCAESLANLLIASGVHEPGLMERMSRAHDRSSAHTRAVLAMIAHGRLCLARSECEAALDAFGKAHVRADALGARREVAEALLGLAETLRAADTQGARRYHVAAYAGFKALACRHGKARAIAGLGTCSLEVGKRESAVRAFRLARETFRSTDDVAEEARNEWRLAQVRLLAGDHVAARKGFRSALALYEVMGDTRGRANCLRGLGRSDMLSADEFRGRQRHDEARADIRSAYGFLRQAQRSFSRAFSALGVSECIRSRGEIMLGLGRFGAATAAFRKALAIDEVVGSLRGQGYCHIGLADAALGRSVDDLASFHLARAFALFREGSIMDGLEAVEGRRRRLGPHEA